MFGMYTLTQIQPEQDQTGSGGSGQLWEGSCGVMGGVKRVIGGSWGFLEWSGGLNRIKHDCFKSDRLTDRMCETDTLTHIDICKNRFILR